MKWLHFFRYRFPVLAWAGLIFFLSSLPSIRLPKLSFFSVDKLGHFGVFFILGFLTYRAFEPVNKRPSLSWKRFLFTFVLASSYGVLDEVHQLFVPGRSFDYYDMLADAIGVLVSLILAFLIMKRRVKRAIV